eukprot:TRINITY_DN31001_c0_g1_i1.p1 TRINITY_DN31001_c0_g1~~TRINITY_DN31001_c0_g1_i1.p1  ORF type:complete len:304 (+),score=84.13 TRINITY_DN31001_c0_g1_i1:102-1013(+)
MQVRCGGANDVGVSNEDRWIVHEEEDDWHVYCVMDGHGGKQAVTYVSHVLVELLLDALREQDVCYLEAEEWATFQKGFEGSVSGRYERLEQAVVDAAEDSSGVCVTALVVSAQFPVGFAVHLGDCRVVVARQDAAPRAVTVDHQLTSDPRERERVLATGYNPVANRVAGLEPTRTLGDIDVKDQVPDAVSCVPEVVPVFFNDGEGAAAYADAAPPPRRKGGKKKQKPAKGHAGGGSLFLVILATDGVWGTIDNEEAVTAARKVLFRRGNANPTAAAVAVTNLARNRGSVDDITTIVLVVEGGA